MKIKLTNVAEDLTANGRCIPIKVLEDKWLTDEGGGGEGVDLTECDWYKAFVIADEPQTYTPLTLADSSGTKYLMVNENYVDANQILIVFAVPKDTPIYDGMPISELEEIVSFSMTSQKPISTNLVLNRQVLLFLDYSSASNYRFDGFAIFNDENDTEYEIADGETKSINKAYAQILLNKLNAGAGDINIPRLYCGDYYQFGFHRGDSVQVDALMSGFLPGSVDPNWSNIITSVSETYFGTEYRINLKDFLMAALATEGTSTLNISVKDVYGNETYFGQLTVS